MILIALCFHAKAQGVKPGWLKSDTGWFKKDRLYYMGIQSNQLLQQFISFNSNTSINTNPFLFSYSTNNIETGNGFAFGSGFSVNQNSSNDGVAAVTSKNINVTMRLGWEKKFLQQQRFIPFIGLDGGMGVVFNNTTSVLNQTFNSNIIETQTVKFFLGPSFRGGLNYAITKHVLVGTEFFFNLHISYAETTVNNNFDTEFAPFSIGFQPPTALFLMFRY